MRICGLLQACKKGILALGIVVVGLVSSSCTSTTGNSSGQYVPHQLGEIRDTDPVQGMQFNIQPSKPIYNEGETIEFMAQVKNVSEHPIWVPEKLQPLFIWYYPTGQKDGFLPKSNEPRFSTKNDAVLLKPGESHSITKMIKTDYFPADGIVEFQAILNTPPNKNSELSPYWNARAESNAYGVLVSNHPREYNRYLHGDEDINAFPTDIR